MHYFLVEMISEAAHKGPDLWVFREEYAHLIVEDGKKGSLKPTSPRYCMPFVITTSVFMGIAIRI